MKFETGAIYQRPCAIIQMDDGRKYIIPVFDHLHVDVQFGFPHEHYHIDARFEMEPRMAHYFDIRDGYTAAVIVPGEFWPRFLALENHDVKCVRTTTGLRIPEPSDQTRAEKLSRYDTWYNSYLGKSCPGKRCPHYGTRMLEKDGRLICPLHDLTADAETLKIIAR